jgi:uncharacterized protein (TIGR01777 family)
MRVLVTGATGFIGRALIAELRRDGHAVVAWVRSARRARGLLGPDVDLVESTAGVDRLVAALDACDAVVNLAGESILGGRWTPARKAALRESRVQLTEDLVRAWGRALRRPRVLVSGSAVGYYGDRGDERLDETSARGEGFLATLCEDWEHAARGAEASGARVVLLRTGVVLGRDGGALAQMLTPFRFGAGGPVGSGRQYMPWIHLDDLVGIIRAALVDDTIRGPINGVAPNPVTSREFAAALGHALHRPALLPMPSLALRALFGEGASVLLGSQRVDPAALRAHGFNWTYQTIDAALIDIVSGGLRRSA